MSREHTTISELVAERRRLEIKLREFIKAETALFKKRTGCPVSMIHIDFTMAGRIGEQHPDYHLCNVTVGVEVR